MHTYTAITDSMLSWCRGQKDLNLWKTDEYLDLWRSVVIHHDTKPQKNTRTAPPPTTTNLRKIAQLVRQGQLSRAAGRLTSWGVVEASPTTVAKVEALFPLAPRGIACDYSDALPVEPSQRKSSRSSCGHLPGLPPVLQVSGLITWSTPLGERPRCMMHWELP